MSGANLRSVLEAAGLGEHVGVLLREKFDLLSALEINDDDLEKLGVPMAHRKKMLRVFANDARALAGVVDGAAPTVKCKFNPGAEVWPPPGSAAAAKFEPVRQQVLISRRSLPLLSGVL